MKRLGPLLGLLLTAPGLAVVSPSDWSVTHEEAVAEEAVAMAAALPPGYDRDAVLRAVSRNLRWFGQPAAGIKAAREMSEHGFGEVAPGAKAELPRFIPLKDAMPTRHRCDTGIWRNEDGSQARSPQAQDKWAEDCLLRRDFDWIGLPEVDQVRAVAETLPPGNTKAQVLAMLIRSYRDVVSLRLVERELGAHRAALPLEARKGLTQLMANPALVYTLGHRLISAQPDAD